MKKILVPTDFSEASLKALKVAAYLAKRRQNVAIRLAHVYHVPRVASLPSEDYGYDVRKQNEIRADIKEKLHKIASHEFVKGIKVETMIIPHKGVVDLLEHKDNKDADLIICGIHGKKDWSKTLEGDHTENIIRHAKCPVLTVDQDMREPIRFDDIVFASDFQKDAYKVFPMMKKILDLLHAKLHLVKIVTPQKFETTLHAEKEMRDFAKETYLRNYTCKVFNDDSIELGIHRYAYSINASMIAMETHGKDGFLKYLKGSITESIAHHSDLPVLTIRMNI